MTWLLDNIPLVVVFFALWVGVPVWLVLRHPDTGPQPAQPSALAYLPRQPADAGYRAAA
jgi:hypothetical protein